MQEEKTSRNIKHVDIYDIGLDIGTNSVGWAVANEKGDLCRKSGKNTWGSRLFETADTAADTRVKRTLRRRYNRRKTRIQELQTIMQPALADVDPDLFIRMRQSALWLEDKSIPEKSALFTGKDLSEKEYYKNFPTIYHLRKHLVNSTGKEDIRFIYLAFHHMLKYRGNFLHEGTLSAKDADARPAVERFLTALEEFCSREDISFDASSVDRDTMNTLLTDTSRPRQDRQKEFSALLGLTEDKQAKDMATAMGKGAFGLKANWAKVFPIEDTNEVNFALTKEENVEKMQNEILSEEDVDLFLSIGSLHNAYVLSGILSNVPAGETLSGGMVVAYKQHKEELQQLKTLVRKYFPAANDGISKEYNQMFRGSKYADGTYKKGSVKGYTAYILNKHSYEDFYKEVKKLFASISFDEEDTSTWNSILGKMEQGTYLRKQRISENGTIPHQLHLEEMHAILENQKQYYPVLGERQKDIESLLSFRLPYYVGPLGTNANPKRNKRFGWAQKKEGFENARVTPWNFNQVIDADKAAEDFISNLIGECTYYLGMPVIPKNSLLYSEFCVRQELNMCSIASDGERFCRLDSETVSGIYENVFMKGSSAKVTVEKVRTYIKGELGGFNTAFKGTQKENEFASSLKSYHDFKKILGREIVSGEDYRMVEELILWATVYEDKKILKRRVNDKYGEHGSGELTKKQIDAVCRLRYTGWSKLSREFLEDIKAEYDGKLVSIMDVLRMDKLSSGDRRPMNLMQILADDRFKFNELLEKKNQAYLKERKNALLDDIPGSPAIKRGINQTLKIIDEIVKTTGHAPRRIVVEMAREDVGKTKGNRTKTRAKQLEEAYASITNDMNELYSSENLDGQLKENAERLDKDRLFLYFLQRGKCLYCGKPLNIHELDSYHIDHIIPQALTKDDSLDNRVLVHQNCNEKKLDRYPLPEDLRRKNIRYWKALRNAKLMSAKKFDRLTDDREIQGKQIKGFINRQLVETRQISKHVVTLLTSLYPDTDIETIKAGLSHNLREVCDLPKVRSLNDWHHAHDAYIALTASRFVHTRFPNMAEDLTYGDFTRYAAATKNNKFSFAGWIAGSFALNGFDKETGEVFRDEWNADFEVERLQRCLNYKDCFVTRKLEKLTGEFWDQTVYSPRAVSGNPVPLKNGMDPRKYGFYKNPKSAYFCVVEHDDPSKKKQARKLSMISVPVDASYRIDNLNDPMTLESFMEKRVPNPIVLKGPIFKYQKIEWSGGLYYFTSPSELINARQLWMPHSHVAFFAQAAENIRRKKDPAEGIEHFEENAWDMYEYLCEQIKEHYPRYGGVHEKLVQEKTRTVFQSLSGEEKIKALEEVLLILHCNANHSAPTLKSPSSLGRMTNIQNIASSSADVTYIDTSITGMFERRYKIEL